MNNQKYYCFASFCFLPIVKYRIAPKKFKKKTTRNQTNLEFPLNLLFKMSINVVMTKIIHSNKII